MHENTIQKEAINIIHVGSSKETTYIQYVFGKVKDEVWIDARKVFATKEELINSL